MFNPKNITHRYAATFIVTNSSKVIGQHRDDKPGIDDPGKIGLFGGTIERGEKPQAAAWRELVGEETNLQLEISDLQPFWQSIDQRPLTKEWQSSYFFVVHISDHQLNNLEVYEGQGWAFIEGSEDPKLADVLRPAVRKLFASFNNDNKALS